MTNLQLTYFRDLETKRHNIATEQETARHDYESEVIGYRQAAASQTAAYAAYLQAENAQRMYELQKQLAPYEIALKSAQTRQSNKQAGYITAQTDYVKSQTDYVKEQTATQHWKTGRERNMYMVETTYAASQAKWNLYDTVMHTVTGYISTTGRFANDVVKAVTGVLSLS